MKNITLVLITLASISSSFAKSDSSFPITDKQAGYDQAKYDECADSAEDLDCSEIVEAGI